jgi:nucleoside-diphosphate-sugar epimerase
MRIFVTGATGVVGRRVVPILIGTGHRVTAVGRSPEKRATLQQMGATLNGAYNYLDLTPKGRDEAGRGMFWLRRHDEYAP